MAEWIKFEASTPEKAEVLGITSIMGWDDPDLTVGKLLRVWRWFDQQTIDGNAHNVSAALLDRIAGVSGFVAAMEKVGWIIINEDGVRLPNFDRHNGKTAKDRALTAKRVAKHKTNAEANDKTNADIVTPALPRKEKKRKEVTTGAAAVRQVISQYNEILPELPSATLVTPKRTAAVASFLEWVMTSTRSDGSRRAATVDEAVAWSSSYFRRARDNDFIMGRTAKSADHSNWKPDLEYVLSDKGKIQIVEKTLETA